MLRDESEEGRRLGFDGKVGCVAWHRSVSSPVLVRCIAQCVQQAIHPAQVEVIHNAYSPSEAGECTISHSVSRPSSITRKPTATAKSHSHKSLCPCHHY